MLVHCWGVGWMREGGTICARIPTGMRWGHFGIHRMEIRFSSDPWIEAYNNDLKTYPRKITDKRTNKPLAWKHVLLPQWGRRRAVVAGKQSWEKNGVAELNGRGSVGDGRRRRRVTGAGTVAARRSWERARVRQRDGGAELWWRGELAGVKGGRRQEGCRRGSE
ncbi:heavy metal transport/detoxification superfamily protein [Striga asiatica]|uniref:Heavy metal transport/detoxification superfamily protein n=1 Tax=Striga asiatica TaxID=4170 RepID=A0A5A7PIX4_STRAF|nr:heavy metal transport/detoxification superfamily protein [Striga asiatica]